MSKDEEFLKLVANYGYDKYVIEPLSARMIKTFANSGLTAGDTIDMITGATIVGPYCQWPKTEPRHFIVKWGMNNEK